MDLEMLEDVNSDKIAELGIEYGTSIIGALAVFVLGRWVSKILVRLFKKALARGGVEVTLISFLSNIAYAALLTFVVISALGTLGVNTSSFAAVIAAAGLAIGLALQGSLSNFASGVMIIAFKPFVKGDYIDAAGTSGSVDDVSIFTTTLKTPDNKIVIVPNGAITTETITNYSREKKRRVDMVFGIGYDDDIKLAKNTLKEILSKNKKILKTPAPIIAVSELADSSVNFVCRPWVKTEDYWDVNFAIHEAVKIEFDKKGLTIPYPQQDVNMKQFNSDSTAETKSAADKKPVVKKPKAKKAKAKASK